MIKVKAIVPDSLMLDPDRLKRAIDNALQGAAQAAKVDFKVTTQTWDHKPEFTITKGDGFREVATDDEIYNYVNSGTRAHLILPRYKRRLAFSSQYRAKTRPNWIGSVEGGSGAVDTYSQGVNHPGTKAREFDKEIKDKWDWQLAEIVQRAIDSEVD